MNSKNVSTIKRLFKEYTIKHINKIFIAIFFSILVAGSTSGIAYLLDPAIEKIFINQDQTLMYVIPILIIIVFFTKGMSLYIAKAIMIRVAQELKADVQDDMMKSLISSDTKFIDKAHTGKFISNLTMDVSLIVNLISTALLNLFKDTLSLMGLLFVMFYQNWKLSLVAIIMIPLASIVARSLGKRITKATKETMDSSAAFTTRLVEIFKNHKLIKSFQTEKYENNRSSKDIHNLKEKAIKMTIIFTRNTPVMETLTGIMIAALIFYSGIFSIIYGLILSESFVFTSHDILMGFFLGVPQLAFGFICITIGSRTTPSTTIGLLMLTETLFAPIWVWLFLNEIPPASVLIGGAVIITAIILKSLDKQKITS